MEEKHEKSFFIFRYAALHISLYGCQPKQVELVNMVVGQENLKKLVENPDVIKSAQYESAYKAYMVLGRPCSFGPTDPAYRGIIKLTEEDGKNFSKSMNGMSIQAHFRHSQISTQHR